jgi:tRNA (uracil-5-)-methyltransferase TRM9
VDERTRRRLTEITADFYRFHADTFDRTRQQAWHSWPILLPLVKPHLGSVLDLGCGNARFARFLLDNGLTGFAYTGVDSNAHLIDKARQVIPSGTFECRPVDEFLAGCDDYESVVAFGLFHHLPGRKFRNQTIRSITKRLRPNGVAVISLWQARSLANFQNKATQSFAEVELSGNDFFLGWQRNFERVRYCHHFDDAEIGELVSSSGLQLVRELQGEGNDHSNRYLVLRKV